MQEMEEVTKGHMHTNHAILKIHYRQYPWAGQFFKSAFSN